VYAHGSIGHLLANALALLLVGPLVERRTTRLRFHAFVIGTGALAGITQVTLGGLLGPQTAVLGLSGAVFGLGGYLLASNVVSATLFDRLRLSTRAQFAFCSGLLSSSRDDDSGAGSRDRSLTRPARSAGSLPGARDCSTCSDLATGVSDRVRVERRTTATALASAKKKRRERVNGRP